MRNGGNPATFACQDSRDTLLSVVPADGFFRNVSLNSPVLLSDSYYPMAFGRLGPFTAPDTMPSEIDSYHILAGILYQVSNSICVHQNALELFNFMAERVPKRLMFDIFRCSSVSIRATWQGFFDAAMKSRDKKALVLLIEIVLEMHPEWIEQDKDCVLSIASLTGNTTLVKQLLDGGAVPTYSDGKDTVFCLAVRNGAVDCAKALVERCDPNSSSTKIDKSKHGDSIFTQFLCGFSRTFDQYRPKLFSGPSIVISDYFTVLQCMLEAGANVDSLFPLFNCYYHQYSLAYKEMGFPLSKRPTCLDLCFYKHRAIFERMAPYSHAWKHSLSRAGVCSAILLSKDALTQYLRSKSTCNNTHHQYLQMTLADQFFFIGGSDRLDYHVVIARGLVEYGVELGLLVRRNRTPIFSPLLSVVSAATSSVLDERLMFLLERLLGEGAVINETVLETALLDSGSEVLRILLSYGDNFELAEKDKLRLADRYQDRETVSGLCRARMDLNSQLCFQNMVCSIMARSILATREEEPKLLPERKATFNLVLCALSHADNIGDWEYIGRLLEVLRSRGDLDHFSPSQWLELFLCSLHRGARNFLLLESDRSALVSIVHAFYRRCDHPLPRPVLSAAILAGCPPCFIEALIGSGQRIDDFCVGCTPLQAAAKVLNVQLVSSLIRLGADLNSSGRGRFGGTALQLVCGRQPIGCTQMARHREVVELLIASGADVNAPPHGAHGATALQLICTHECATYEDAAHTERLLDFLIESGADANALPGLLMMTALQYCAGNGDLRKAASLIQHGADPNGYPCLLQAGLWSTVPEHYSALDAAASRGRLDMTQYLLNVGALSAKPGETGFEGAIEIARRERRWAVADAIQMHSEKIASRSRLCQKMSMARKECIKRHAAALEERRRQYEEWCMEDSEAKLDEGYRD